MSFCFKKISFLLKLCKLFLIMWEVLSTWRGIRVLDLFSKQLNDILVDSFNIFFWISGVWFFKSSPLFWVSNFWHFNISLPFFWWSKSYLCNIVWLLCFLVIFSFCKSFRKRSKDFFTGKIIRSFFKQIFSFIAVFW